MKESIIGQKFLGLQINRRQFNEAFIKTIGALLVLETLRGTLPREDEFGFIENLSAETRHQLLLYNPKTIAHRGGNSIKHLELSKQAGVDFVEVDLKRYLGRSLITHGEKWPAVAYDHARRLFGLSGSIPNVFEISQGIKDQNQNFFIDLKGDSPLTLVEAVNITRKNGLEDKVSYFGNWQTLDILADVFDRRDNLFYSIGNPIALYRFLNEQPQRKAQGVSLDIKLASEETISILHQNGCKVYVYGVHTSKEAIEVLEYGADGLISNNLSLLSVWGKQPTFFV